MPTRPRYVVTEADELAVALDEAARRWPGLSRTQLLVRLALHGHEAARHARQYSLRRRREAIRRHSGSLTGAYGPSYLKALRADWPT